MKAGVNRYRVDLRELQFALFEQFKVGEVLGKAPFDAWGEQECRDIIKQSARFGAEVLGPLNETGDRQGCRLESGQVKTPDGFKAAWKQLHENGFKLLDFPAEVGGQGAPKALRLTVDELLIGANTSFSLYAGLTQGAAEVIEAFGTKEQLGRYLEKMMTGVWGGTMCLTEPNAGSDVGACASKAVKNSDGSYSITGTKVFISAGDHDLSENIIHLVLARIQGAPAGTKGLSLFIVPKIKIKPDGSLGESNDVSVGTLEHKLGINGSATCLLNFGENGNCRGELVGSVEHQGMAQMFKMMNNARIAVGVQGLALASTSYLNALDYARERKQGSSFKNWKDANAPRVAIIEHADVRRMLLDMKAKVEGMRAMIIKLGAHQDRAAVLGGSDEEKTAYHRGQVDLLTPLVKAYGSDTAFQVCTTALQTYGGAGFTKDYPAEQYLRDSKIFSIYEGTNHIQAMDLVGRKLGQAGGAHLMQFLADVGSFVEANKDHPAFGAEVKQLAAAQEAVANTAMSFMGWGEAGKLELLPSVANRFLEMMAELTVGWLLLDAGIIAEAAAKKLSAEHPDRKFYEGKKFSALWFAREVLPTVPLKAQLIASENRAALEVPADALATI